MTTRQAIEMLAEASIERGLTTLAEYFGDVQNIPAELLDSQMEQELQWAEYALNLLSGVK